MNLYLVKRPENYDNYYCGCCGTYIEFIICCDTEQEARKMHPSGNKEVISCGNKTELISGWVNGKDIDLLEVTLLGKADSLRKRGVISSKYYSDKNS